MVISRIDSVEIPVWELSLRSVQTFDELAPNIMFKHFPAILGPPYNVILHLIDTMFEVSRSHANSVARARATLIHPHTPFRELSGLYVLPAFRSCGVSCKEVKSLIASCDEA